MAEPQSRLQRGYVQLESSWAVIPNSTGTATLANGDAFLSMELLMNEQRQVNQRPDRTGTLDLLVGTRTKRSSTFSTRMSLAGSGSAGTAPDIDAFLVALMGKAGTVSSGTSVTYDCEDANPSLAVWDFNALSTADQLVIGGAVIQSGRFEFGSDYTYAAFSGEGHHVLSKLNYSNETTEGRMGLSAFPSEPGSPTTAGTSVSGYTGTITLDSNTYSTLRSGSIDIAVARALPKDRWGSDFPGAPGAGARVVTLNWSMYDDDSANLTAFKNKARNGTAVNCSFAIGTIAGNIWTFNCKNILFEEPQYGYGEVRRTVDFRGTCASTTLTSKDPVQIVLS